MKLTVIGIYFAVNALFGLAQIGMSADFAYAAHGSMGAAMDCMIRNCPMPMNGTSSAPSCAGHCLLAASMEADATPIFAAVFVFAAFFIALRFRLLAPETMAKFRRFFSNIFERLSSRMRLATIVLRN